MISSEPARTSTPRPRLGRIVTGVAVVVALIAAVRGNEVPPATSSTATAPREVPRGEPAVRRSGPSGPLGEADGAVPDGATVFDDGIEGVARLAPALLAALRRAASAAAADGVVFTVDSGWRSPEYQEQLLREAIAKYGSVDEARRWVATPDTSAHVSGNAVDVGTDAAAWLSAHGAEFGLCPIYGNEPWHYELRPEAAEHGCPAVYADPTQDPRLQQ